MDKFLPLLTSVIVVFGSGFYLTRGIIDLAAYMAAMGAIIYITTHTH